MKNCEVREELFFWQTLILGLFGIGHLYLRRTVRGLGFAGYSAVLYIVIALLFALPRDSVILVIITPALWPVGFGYCLPDTRSVARRVERREERKIMKQMNN